MYNLIPLMLEIVNVNLMIRGIEPCGALDELFARISELESEFEKTLEKIIDERAKNILGEENQYG